MDQTMITHTLRQVMECLLSVVSKKNGKVLSMFRLECVSVIFIMTISLHLPLDNNCNIFSAANLTLSGFPLTNALGESMPSRH